MIKAIKSILFLSVIPCSFLSLLAFGQDVTQPLETEAFLGLLLQGLGGLKGASTLAIVAFVVQTVMHLFRTPLANFAGKWKLVIVVSLSLVGTVLGLMVQGMGFLPALFNGATLAAVQVLVNQVIKQFSEKPAEAPKA